MRFLSIVLFLTTCLSSFPNPYDLDSARAYCDNRPLDAAEGIWEFTEDGLSVLIIKSMTVTDKLATDYDIIALNSADGSTLPGEKIGELHATSDPRKFELRLSDGRKKGGFIFSNKCAATLNAEGDALTVKMPKLGISFHPAALLPRFWRLVRIHSEKPADELPAGLVKSYPSYDGNGSSRLHPRYL